jgi:hypothetical protein
MLSPRAMRPSRCDAVTTRTTSCFRSSSFSSRRGGHLATMDEPNRVCFDFAGEKQVQYVTELPSVGGRPLTVTVEPASDELGDLLRSEEGALVLAPAD